MILAHKTRVNPTPDQEEYFRKACGIARYTWNRCLENWNTLYAEGQKPSALLVKKEFNASKKEECPWIYDVCKSVPEYAIRDLAKAFNNFWRGNGAGHPKFKSRKCRGNHQLPCRALVCIHPGRLRRHRAGAIWSQGGRRSGD